MSLLDLLDISSSNCRSFGLIPSANDALADIENAGNEAAVQDSRSTVSVPCHLNWRQSSLSCVKTSTDTVWVPSCTSCSLVLASLRKKDKKLKSTFGGSSDSYQAMGNVENLRFVVSLCTRTASNADSSSSSRVASLHLVEVGVHDLA